MGFLEKVLSNDLKIPDFKKFTKTLENFYYECKEIKDGKVAEYIPELAKADPNWFAISACTVDG